MKHPLTKKEEEKKRCGPQGRGFHWVPPPSGGE
jgi:hypothetical protein